MKSTSPWSVKGIARDTRETAKEAARKEGMTVGEWLNHIIHQAGQGDIASSGEVVGMATRDLVTAIEHLSNQVNNHHTTYEHQINVLAKSLTDISQRIDKVETGGGNSSPDLSGDSHIDARLVKLEAALDDRSRIETLRSLEKALSQIAVHHQKNSADAQNRMATSEEKLETLSGQVGELVQSVSALAPHTPQENSASAEWVSSIVKSLENRLDRIEQDQATQASPLPSHDPDFAERTGKRLRVLGDEIKRSGDQVRDLETQIGRLADQIDAAEKRSADGIRQISDTITQLNTKPAPVSDIDRSAIQDDLAKLVSEAFSDVDRKIAELKTSLSLAKSVEQQANLPHEENATTPVDAHPINGHQDPIDQHKVDSTPTNVVDQDLSNLVDEALLNDAPSPLDQFDQTVLAAAAETPTSFITDDGPPQHSQTPDHTGLEQGTLEDDADDVEEISIEGDIDTAFDDFEFSDSDEVSSTSERATPEAPSSTFSFDAGEEEARKISAEINQGLISDPVPEGHTDEGPKPTAPPFNPAPFNPVAEFVPDEDSFDAIANSSPLPTHEEQIPGNDPLAAPGETIAARLHGDHHPHSTDNLPHTPPLDATDKPELSNQAQRTKAALAKLPRTEDGRIDVARLTPKQRAVLAARAKRKREQARSHTPGQTGFDQLGDGSKGITDPTQSPSQQTASATMDEHTQAAGLLAKITAIFKRGPKPDPVSGGQDDVTKKKELIDHNGPDIPDQPTERYSLLFVDGKLTPLAVLLGMLVAAFLILLVARQYVFKPAVQTDTPNQSNIGTSSGQSLSPSRGDDIVIESPSGDSIIRPRELFLSAMAVLQSNPEQETADNAMEDLIRAASLGYPPAQFQLGEYFKDGTFIEENPTRARTWFQRSANGGNVFAMHRLGYLYAEGKGGSADIITATEWFEQAANRGFVDSQFNLGAIFDPGPDVAPTGYKDLEKSYYWYALAAKNGDAQAGQKANELAARITAEQKSDTDARVATWSAIDVDPVANENLVGAGN